MLSSNLLRSAKCCNAAPCVALLFTALLAVALVSAAKTARSAEPAAITADDALAKLLKGNARFVAGKLHSVSTEELKERRAEVAHGQKPFAVIVSCSDSRVGPEIVFDQGLGDIFVVRTAGEVVDNAALGSIEYAVLHLGTPLIVVLGHERCGAVAAAVADAKEPGHIGDVIKAIQPAVAETKGQPGDPVDNAIRANVGDVVQRLKTSDAVLAERVKRGQLKISGAYISLDTGKVELLGEPSAK
jgi:carbonic anhydrase